LTTFAVALNNHLPAAVCAAITLLAVCRIWYDGQRGAGVFAIAGFFAACTAAFELPALSFFALISVGLLVKSPRRTLLVYSPAALVVVAAFFATNWLAHGSLIPPYAHRDYSGFSGGDQSDRFEDTIKVDSGDTVTLRGHKENWYDYEFTRTDGKLVSSYWRPENRQGIDAGEPSVGKYAANLLVGHHGIFSLTPIWLLAIPGVLLLWWNEDYANRDLAILILLISVVCIAFYISRPLADRNYGGMTSGFRWVFWMTPLWLLAVLPTADWLSRRRLGRLAGCVVLALSVLSAAYPVWNPWTHPWLQNLWIYMRW
jgi:energy-coupling factor transporter transmembrane protein EcfT